MARWTRGQDVVEVLDRDPAGALGAGVVFVTDPGQPAIGRPAIGVHVGAGRDGILHETAQGVCRGVVDDLHPQSTRPGAADLDGHDN